jgi:hypothetical protein
MKKVIKKKLARTPTLPAGTHTSYKVLKFVRNIIAKEPKRLYMRNWLTLFKGEGYPVPGKSKPACGTVCCVGGWICVATKHTEVYGSGKPIRILGLCNAGDAYMDLDAIFGYTEAKPKEVLVMLDKYMTKYESLLKGRTVEVGKDWER